MTIRSCLMSATLSPLVSPLGRVPAHLPPGSGAGGPQCRPRANCDGCSYLRHASQCVAGLRVLLPTVCSCNCVDLRRPPLRDALPPRRAAGPGADRVGQGLTVTAAPTLDPHSLSVSLASGGRAPTLSAKG